jgi:3-hydroxybutyryl-CoA dehydratase
MNRGHGLFFEDLRLGMEATQSRVISEADILAFAAVTGDDNPIHLDPAYAATTPFKRPISQGMLTATFISAILGTRLPGPGAIYVSQTLHFKAPVYIGDRVETAIRLIELIEARRRAVFSCICSVGDKIVLEGTAVIMIPSRESK